MTRSHRIGLAALALALAACGPAPRSHGNGDGTSGDDDNPDGSCTGALTCSGDGLSVVDCHGNTVSSCNPGEMCSAGACLNACDAAAANKASIGCDYYTVDPDLIEPGGCFAAYIANTSQVPTTITVDYNGASLPVDSFARIPSGQGTGITYAPLTGGMLQPNQIAILFLASTGSFIPCPTGITPAVTATDPALHTTSLGAAFHIATSEPVVAYDIQPYGGGQSAITSATLLLPTSAWDKSYIAVDAYAQTAGSPDIDIVAQTAGTHVTIFPVADLQAGTGVAGASAGGSATYTLDAGELMHVVQGAELGGSPIIADQPIGVWGGASCMDVPGDQVACDGAHQEIPPVNAMGDRYLGVRYRNRYEGREETVPWRLVGAVDGTTLSYEPSTPPGAPTTLSKGQVIEFDAPGPFEVQSQGSDHPFYASGYMTGCSAADQNDPDFTDCRGDPEFVNIIPPDQYLASYTFFTDPTYPETNLVVTRERHNGNFADVSVDCAGTLTGWMPIDTADTLEYTRLDLVTGNFQGVGSCNNGLHVASSTAPFGLVVWGWGTGATSQYTQAVSYAYPAGASVQKINSVVIVGVAKP